MGHEPVPRTRATAHTVAYLTARTRSGTVERFHRRREVVCLRLHRNNALDILHLEPVGRRLIGGSKLFHHRTLCKRHIVLVGRQNLIGILLGCLLDHREERRFLLLAIDDECSAENLMTAVLRVDLGEAEDLRVGQRTTILLLQTM